MDTLFPMQQSFHVVRLTEQDAVRSTDHLRLFDDQIALNDEMYPGIKTWFRKKVVPGLKDGSRVAYLGFEDDAPILTAIVKRGERAKFCHLRVASDFQGLKLGEVFFSVMALEVRNTAKEIHFTLPESLWHQQGGFFKSFGFEDVVRARTQYRLFEEELRASASFWDVWRAVRQRLPNLVSRLSINEYSTTPNLLLSVKPEYANRLLRGEKTVEIRRKFHSRWRGSKVAIYSSSPERALIGEATVDNVKGASPEEIWGLYSDRIGCSRSEFLAYTEKAEQVFAIELGNVVPYAAKMPLCQFEFLLEQALTPPQSHCEIHGEHAWGKAISIAALLHGCQRGVGLGNRTTAV